VTRSNYYVIAVGETREEEIAASDRAAERWIS
jgi:hypothetical protein